LTVTIKVSKLRVSLYLSATSTQSFLCFSLKMLRLQWLVSDTYLTATYLPAEVVLFLMRLLALRILTAKAGDIWCIKSERRVNHAGPMQR